MRFLLSGTLAFVLGFSLVQLSAQQQGSANSQNPSAPQSGSGAQTPRNDIPSPDDEPQASDKSSAPVPAADSGQQDQTSDQQEEKKSRGQRAKEHVKKQMSSWCVGAPVNHCYEKKPSDDSSSKDAQTQTPRPPRSDDTKTPPPPAPGESSSNDTKVDLSPPPGDTAEHPESSPDEGPGEFHAWDPHRAMKNVEVGDYYYKRGNYRAAVSRYQEALEWKPRDAEATYKLADAQEKMGNKLDAKKNYQAYLTILPNGPRSDDANKALARLK